MFSLPPTWLIMMPRAWNEQRTTEALARPERAIGRVAAEGCAL
ncbi:hypothetical protein BJ969_003096 [Saccharopolyspora gloriosae]|uniref:Uncharacterized protein n=1 Tax=Saccharopolyspora gloriosae TaxID=455344 RepID=A0A840NI89_9PSEU|nr:hypothetical protein [Saccharopolyspora gloriosae]MBB5070008.1 hypothetical protein [Saccharopolyspora gloriosae]